MTNEDIIESVISLLAVDGTLNKHEMQFFNDLCKRLEISKKAKNVAIDKARQGKGRVHLPEDENDKKRLLYFLVQAVVADGSVASQERKILDAVVAKLGMADVDVDNFIKSRLKEVKSEKYTTASKKPPVECPKCGYKQPASHKCRRCGIIFKKYKESQGPSDADRLMEILASSNVIKGKDES